MIHLEKLHSRRSFLGLAGVLALLPAVPASLRPKTPLAGSSYEVVNHWRLLEGGQGLFIATRPDISHAELKELDAQLRDEFRNEPNMVVQIFDDAAAAKDARAGSRIVGEPTFSAAIAHQKASYLKNAVTGQHVFIIFSQPPEVIRY